MTTGLEQVDWPVRTERLVLRPVTSDDLEAVWQIRRQPVVSEWLTSAPATFEQFRARFENPKRFARTFAIERVAEPGVIGDLMIAVQDAWAQTEVAEQAKGTQAELGWVLDPQHQGHGYATEAVGAAIRICFEDLGLRRVMAGCFADNVASWRLMERLGMRREEHALRESLHRSGRWLDGMAYGLLADEWRAREAGEAGAPAS
jgi:RimJ/RimL family protein N-acetyltransferase